MKNEHDTAFETWYEELQTVDEMFTQLESAEGPGIKAKGPPGTSEEG